MKNIKTLDQIKDKYYVGKKCRIEGFYCMDVMS